MVTTDFNKDQAPTITLNPKLITKHSKDPIWVRAHCMTQLVHLTLTC